MRGIAASHVLVGIGLSVVFVLGSVAYLTAVRTSTEEEILATLASAQDKGRKQFDAWYDRRVSQARQWADRRETRELTAELLAMPSATPSALNDLPRQIEYRQLFSAALGREGLQGYFIISPQGVSLGSLGTDNTGTPNLLIQEPEFLQRVRRQGSALSPLMTSDVRLQNAGAELDGKPLTLFIGVPVKIDGEFKAYYTIRVPSISLLSVANQLRFGRTGDTFLVDTQGRLHADRVWLDLDLGAAGLGSEPLRARQYLLARDPGTDVRAPHEELPARASMPLTESARKVAAGPGSSLRPYRDHRGVKVVGAWHWDEKLNLGVISEISAAEAFAPIVASRVHVLVAGFVLACTAIVLLMSSLWRSQRRLHRALVRAEAASVAKGTFLANVSHEIRTPMNAIVGLVHLSQRDASDPVLRARLAKISGAAHHLLRVINDVLDLAKIESGKLELERSSFAVDTLMARTFALVSESAQDKGLELVLDTDSLPSHLVGDATRLSQMLLNLLSNAVKFTRCGWVRLQTRMVQEQRGRVLVRFQVQDTGEGISQERQERLFHAFVQTDSSAERRSAGTGLGLALTREFALAMGGEAGVSSEPGKGSTFWFTAWLDEAGEAGSSPAPAAMLGLRALLVDDLEEARNAIGDQLRTLGFEVHEFGDPERAIQAFKNGADAKTNFDVMLIDWKMHPLDGIQTLARIRTILGRSTPPAILVTAGDDPGLKQLASAAGFDAVMLKPLTASAVDDQLSSLLHKRRTRAESAVETSVQPLVLLTRRHAGQAVLLAEDNPVNREVAEELLRSAELIVETANDGRQAVDMACSRSYDAILMDMQMPLMDGLEAVRRIRARIGASVPIIAMTAHAFGADRQASLDAGMNDHVSKPVDPDTLYETLLRWMAVRHAVPNLQERPMATTHGDALLERLAMIGGLDLSTGMNNLGGRSPTLERVLRQFATHYARSTTVFPAPGSEGEALKWREALHSLRGAASVIGAHAIARGADALEKQLRQEPAYPDPSRLAAPLRRSLDDFVERLAAALDS